MAEIDLVSSHEPWTPLPRMVDWADVGDGSVSAPCLPRACRPRTWSAIRTGASAYAESIRYSLTALISWVSTFRPDDDLVVLLLGDHQPASIVSGTRRLATYRSPSSPRPRRAGPGAVLALGPGAAARPGRAGVADGRLPRPVPRRLRARSLRCRRRRPPSHPVRSGAPGTTRARGCLVGTVRVKPPPTARKFRSR